MAKTQRNFVLGRMNKSLDERLLPNGEYVDALNVRLGSTEESEVGSVENTKGNSRLTELYFIDPITTTNTPLSSEARTIGVYEDGANETLYWFVHDPNFSLGDTGKLDMIVSLNVLTGQLTYHVISIDDGTGENTTLNFNPQYLITGTDKVGDLLFFTDFLNPPRFINVRNAYAEPIAGSITITNPNQTVAFVFTAGSYSVGGFGSVGFHRGTLLGCPVATNGIGVGAAPTTTQINLPGTGCYTFGSTVFNQNTPIVTGFPTTPGYGIQGANDATGLALTMFLQLSDGTTTIGLILSSGTSNPGTGIIFGNISGSDGSSGIFSANYSVSILSYTDEKGAAYNPEATGPLQISGLTLVDGVTYTLTI
tara:strand:+ start:1940 stop:3037 length:1098 start_codon:yes stop_codon:yes gene_type:complete